MEMNQIETCPDNMLQEMYIECGTPAKVIRHMQAVAAFQDQLLDDLEAAGLDYDRVTLRRAALLHDICRHRHDHAEAGAAYLESKGFCLTAELVRDHHRPAGSQNCRLTPADILFYSDKRLLGENIVSLQERFASSRSKCLTPDASCMHDAQYERAVMIEEAVANVLSSNGRQE